MNNAKKKKMKQKMKKIFMKNKMQCTINVIIVVKLAKSKGAQVEQKSRTKFLH